MIGVAGAQIKLAKDFLAEKNDNPDYQEALEDMSSLLLGILENNLEEIEEEDDEKKIFVGTIPR